MNMNYATDGYVTVKIKIEDVYNCKQEITSEDIAEMVQSTIETMIGKCQIMNHDVETKLLAKINRKLGKSRKNFTHGYSK